jgi:hypothetical protein
VTGAFWRVAVDSRLSRRKKELDIYGHLFKEVNSEQAQKFVDLQHLELVSSRERIWTSDLHVRYSSEEVGCCEGRRRGHPL